MVRLPSVHMNGTSKDELIRQNMDAYRAVETALDVLSKAAPHGRDYYPQNGLNEGVYDTPFILADQDHHDRLLKLASVRDDLLELIGGIDMGGFRVQPTPDVVMNCGENGFDGYDHDHREV